VEVAERSWDGGPPMKFWSWPRESVKSEEVEEEILPRKSMIKEFLERNEGKVMFGAPLSNMSYDERIGEWIPDLKSKRSVESSLRQSPMTQH